MHISCATHRLGKVVTEEASGADSAYESTTDVYGIDRLVDSILALLPRHAFVGVASIDELGYFSTPTGRWEASTAQLDLIQITDPVLVIT